MRIEINERLVKRNRRLAQYLFFATLGLLFVGFFGISLLPPTPVLLLAPFVLLPITFGATIFSVRMTNNWLREPTPDKAIEPSLKGLNQESVMYHYWFPAKHVLLSPQGVYTFTIRGQDGNFSVEGDVWARRGGAMGRFMAAFRQDGLGHPFVDAEHDAALLSAFIKQHLPESDIDVQPVVVFTGARAEIEVISPKIPVVHTDPKKRPNLKSLLKDARRQSDKDVITEGEIDVLEQALGFEIIYVDDQGNEYDNPYGEEGADA